MPITVKQPSTLYNAAQNEDGEDEIVFRCTLTNSGILTCTYTDMLEVQRVQSTSYNKDFDDTIQTKLKKASLRMFIVSRHYEDKNYLLPK